MKKGFNLFLILCLLTVTLVTPYSVSAAQEKTLGEYKKELAKYEQEYKENQNQKDISEKELQNTKDRIETIREKVLEINNKIVELEKDIERLNVEIENMEEEIKSILAFTQVSNGESAYLEYAFGAQDFTDFIYRIAVSEQLTSYNNSLVEKYQKNIEDNKKKTAELEEQEKQLEAEKEKLSAEISKISEHLNELDRLAGDIEEQIELAKSYVSAMEKIGCKDDQTLTQCTRNVAPMDKGFIRPMVNSYLTFYFNKSTHLAIDVSGGMANINDVPVYPAADGFVVGVTHKASCGGNKIYIQHNINGKTYTTGYVHLRAMFVKAGDVVTKNTMIGYVGGNPSRETWDTCSTGAHLHFSISTGKISLYSNGTLNLSDYYAGQVDPLNYITMAGLNQYVYGRY